MISPTLALQSRRERSRMMTWSISCSTSWTWWVEMMSVVSSDKFFATTWRKILFEGMSRPLVGSSISNHSVPAARATLMKTFFFWPIESWHRSCTSGSSKAERQSWSTCSLKRG
ncbi:hypothetical protein EVA_06478 [gut metagenome]|uniref:Uncharacterized protein n=1 Tax=gut metagenome TaxID=749906 RepID=J9GXF9_9ZZZZ